MNYLQAPIFPTFQYLNDIGTRVDIRLNPRIVSSELCK